MTNVGSRRKDGGSPLLMLLFFGPFAVGGLGMLGGAVWTASQTVSLLSTAERVPGTVVALELRPDTKRPGNALYPRVRYRDATGDDVVFLGSSGSYPPAFSLGEAVTVLYDPENRADARIESFWQLWFGPLFLGLMGLLFSGLGNAPWLIRLWSKRRKARLVDSADEARSREKG
jgi:hypothetical protein